MTLAFGLLGFLDDYAKVTRQTHRRHLRLGCGWLIEASVAVLAVFLMVRFGQPSPDEPHLATSLAFPVFKRALLEPRLVLPRPSARW